MAEKVSHSEHQRRRLQLTIHAASLTLGGSAERLAAGKCSPRVRETASSVYHVISGSGHSVIGSKTVTWKEHDTFCIPAWYPYQHFGADGDTAYLYRFDDKPMLTSLGFYRVEGNDTEEYVSK